MNNRMIELAVDEDNFVTVGSLVKALQKVPQELKVLIPDDEYSLRALRENDVYISYNRDKLYIGLDVDETYDA